MGPLVTEFIKQFTHYTYLGDGAYVGKNSYEVIVFTTDGYQVQNRVHLEASAVKEFCRFATSKEG